jgi:hypothetical protein
VGGGVKSAVYLRLEVALLVREDLVVDRRAGFCLIEALTGLGPPDVLTGPSIAGDAEATVPATSRLLL